MRCGSKFTSWLWEPPPANDAFRRGSDADVAVDTNARPTLTENQAQTADSDSSADAAKSQ